MEECPICLVGYAQNARYVTNCQHEFCHDCLLKHLKTKNTCPLCRAIVKEAKVVSSFLHNDLVRLQVKKGRVIWELLMPKENDFKVVAQFFGKFFDVDHKRLKIISKGKVIDEKLYRFDSFSEGQVIQILASVDKNSPWKADADDQPYSSTCLLS
mmetsp:Transcript_47741/g.120177  ORF Transcript_47741/g.120177 Transcript_47741/m.120177 type:complete len:155 (+) Transcript_47741:21-485(+)